MRLARVRLTVRRMMVGVVLTGAVIEAGKLVHRAAVYRRAAASCAALERVCQSLAALEDQYARQSEERAYQEIKHWVGIDDEQHRASVAAHTQAGQDAIYLRQSSRKNAAEAAWYARLRRRYRHAVTHPWEVLPPDPPRPAVRLPPPVIAARPMPLPTSGAGP